MEILAGLPLRTQLIVRGTLFRVLQNLVSLPDFLELCFCVGFLADIGVVFTRQLAVSALDFILCGVFLDAHDLVVILVFHRIS